MLGSAERKFRLLCMRRAVLFSAVSVCVFVCCLSGCQHVDNSCSVRVIVTEFSGRHPVVERADKFENDYIGVRGW